MSVTRPINPRWGSTVCVADPGKIIWVRRDWQEWLTALDKRKRIKEELEDNGKGNHIDGPPG